MYGAEAEPFRKRALNYPKEKDHLNIDHALFFFLPPVYHNKVPYLLPSAVTNMRLLGVPWETGHEDLPGDHVTASPRVPTQPAFTRWHGRLGGSTKVSLRSVISGMGVSASFPCVSLSRMDNLSWIICNWRWIPRLHGKGECCKVLAPVFEEGNYRPGRVGVRACV